MARKRTDSDIGKCDGAYFGSIVRKLRMAKKMTIKTFAERVGISRNYVSQLEAGDKLPNFETLIMIAKVLEVTPNELLVDYMEPSQSAEIHVSQIEQGMSGLSYKQQKHVQKMVLAEIDFLKKQ